MSEGTVSDPQVAKADRRATMAMVLGLSSLMCSCFTGIPAVALGAMALGQASPGHRVRAIVGIASGGIMTLMLFVFAALAPSSGPAVGASSVGDDAGQVVAAVPLPPAPTLPIPEEQAAFCAMLDDHASAYRAAPNDLKKSAVRGARKRAMASMLGRGRVNGWVGHAKALTTNGDGKAVFVVSLPCTGSVGTWNNAFSDIMSNTLIPQSSALFGTLAELDPGGWGKDGSAVRFTGTFVDGSGPDAFGEMSLTERGSMVDPTFVFRFASVEPL